MRHSASSKPMATLRLLVWSQRKLFLLVFLWTCLCLVIFKSTRQTDVAPTLQDGGASIDDSLELNRHHQQARSASSLSPSSSLATSEQSLFAFEILAPEFDLPTRPVAVDVNDQQQQQQQQEQKQPQPDKRHHYQLVELPASPSNPQEQQQNGAEEEDKRVSPTSEPASENKAPPVTVARRVPPVSAQPRSPSPPPPSPPTKQVQDIAGSQCHYDYPNLFDLQFNNIHWQKFTSNARELNLTNDNLKPATFYLYNAYYDDRWRAGQPSVRVLAMVDRIHPPPTNCLLWSNRLASGGDDNHQDLQQGDSQPRPPPLLSSATTDSKRLSGAPIVTRAQFVYAWYPKWGNYEDGLLQPWIVTCPVPRQYAGLVPDSVSLVDVPVELTDSLELDPIGGRDKRDLSEVAVAGELASMPMPPSYSSSSSSSPRSSLAASNQQVQANNDQLSAQSPASHSTTSSSASSATPVSLFDSQPPSHQYDCNSIQQPISNNLPVFNRRPPPGSKREKFAVCVKGLDFPYDNEHVSIRLVEWIELLNLLGAKKIFLYNLNVHENISKVLHHYQKRGLVELSPLTLPGNQPNLPEYQHLYLKQKLTSKRQNELLPYNDCLYRNLYSYQYLALLDIDEIIMPLKGEHNNWHDLMEEVERKSYAEQNYSRASYNVRNVYFFDDLSGPLGTTQSSRSGASGGSSTLASVGDMSADMHPQSKPATTTNQQHTSARHHHDSAERGIPHYLHMMSHVYRSKNYTEPGQYVKCFHNTERVISLHNHFPMNCFGQCTTYSIPVDLAHLQHYRKDCVGPLKQSCKNDFRLFTTRDTTIWKYKERMIKRTTRALSHLGLLANYNNQNHNQGHHRQQVVASAG